MVDKSIFRILNDLLTGEQHLGDVGGYGIVSSTTITRPADTTAYTAKDAVGVSLAITGATNASPIVITCATHGLSDGDPVTISGVGGNTNANCNACAKVTGYSTTTFALYTDKALTIPVAGNSNYTTGGIVAKLFRIQNFFRKNGGSGYIVKVRAMTDLSTFTDQFKIHTYNSYVTAIADNSPYAVIFANASLRCGTISLPSFSTEGTGSDTANALSVSADGSSGLPLYVWNNDNSKDFVFGIENLSSGTPASGQRFFIEFTLDSN